MIAAPDVSVIVATYNRCEVLRGALDSLLHQETGGTTYEVIVADNNSTDDTRRVAARRADLLLRTGTRRFVRAQPRHHARARADSGVY